MPKVDLEVAKSGTKQGSSVKRPVVSTVLLDPNSANQCDARAVSNKKYLNCGSRLQLLTTKSRTLAKLHKCERKAESS